MNRDPTLDYAAYNGALQSHEAIIWPPAATKMNWKCESGSTPRKQIFVVYISEWLLSSNAKKVMVKMESFLAFSAKH